MHTQKTRDKISAAKIRHGFSKRSGKHPLYAVFENMLKRCNNPKRTNYKYYGGKGVRVEWETFEAFRDDMLKPWEEHVKKYGIKDTFIGRIDRDGNYSKENCEWITRKENMRDTSRTKFITYQGQTKALPVWCEEVGLPQWFVAQRLKRGWSFQRAIMTPNLHRKRPR